MKKLLIASTLLIATIGTGFAAGGWTDESQPDGTIFSRNEIDGKTLWVRCLKGQPLGHEVKYGVPAKFVDHQLQKLSEVDLVLEVDAHGGVANDYVKTARVKITKAGDTIFLTVTGQTAWDFASAVASSDWITISLAPDYKQAKNRLFGVTSYRTGGATEIALRKALAACAPKT